MAALKSQGGAALLILLAVAGLGAASLLMSGLGKVNTQAGPERRTVVSLAQAREALLGYAAIHGRLPRPAQSATIGVEREERCDSEDSCTGLLPWVTLGIAPGDGWGHLLRYSVTPALSSAPVQVTEAFGTKVVLRRAPGGQLAYAAGHPQCSMAAQCAAAVVLSHGKEHFGVSIHGVRQAGAAIMPAARANLDERANAFGSSAFVMRAAGSDAAAPGGAFDDQLAWLSFDAVLGRMSRTGMLPRGE